VRGIEETGGLTEKLNIAAFYGRLHGKKARWKIKVYAPEFQSQLIGRGKLRELSGGERHLLDYSGNRPEQFRITARLHQSFGYPKKIVLEKDGQLRAALESLNYLSVHL